MQEDLFFEVVALLYVAVDLVEHVFIVLDALEVAGED